MELRDWITLGGIVVAASVPLIAMRWKVRSERHLALFQKGLVTDVKPPPSPWWGWLGGVIQKISPWSSALGIVAAVSSLVKDARSSEPMTRVTVIWIACNAAAVVFLSLTWLVRAFIQQVDAKTRELAEQQRTLAEVVKTLVEMVRELRKGAATRG